MANIGNRFGAISFIYVPIAPCPKRKLTQSDLQSITDEPQKARPDLADSYDNLMYACDECNMRKGDRCPPPEARGKGLAVLSP